MSTDLKTIISAYDILRFWGGDKRGNLNAAERQRLRAYPLFYIEDKS